MVSFGGRLAYFIATHDDAVEKSAVRVCSILQFAQPNPFGIFKARPIRHIVDQKCSWCPLVVPGDASLYVLLNSGASITGKDNDEVEGFLNHWRWCAILNYTIQLANHRYPTRNRHYHVLTSLWWPCTSLGQLKRWPRRRENKMRVKEGSKWDWGQIRSLQRWFTYIYYMNMSTLLKSNAG